MNNLPDESSTLLGFLIFFYVAWSIYTMLRWAGKDIAWRYGYSFRAGKPFRVGTILDRFRIITIIPAMAFVGYFLYAFFYVTGNELYRFLNVGIRGLYEYYIK